MSIENKSDFKFDKYIIRDSKLSINQDDKLNADELSLEIIPKGVKYAEKFILTLNVIIKDDNDKFDLNISIDGYFTFRENISPQEISKYFILNAPAIMFPYIRGYITMLTSLSGIGTITLPLLNLVKLSKELAENIDNKE